MIYALLDWNLLEKFQISIEQFINKCYQLDVKVIQYRDKDSEIDKIWSNFFDDIKKDANMLTRDLKQVVIELDNNKKLLNLFMKVLSIVALWLI